MGENYGDEYFEESRSIRDGSYQDLEIYRLAHQFGIDVHHLTLNLPKFELYETGSQLRRSSKSISANIVEGYGRRAYKAEFQKFLIYAFASCLESSEWLNYIRDCHPSLAPQANEAQTKLAELGRKLNKFMQAVQSGHRSRK